MGNWSFFFSQNIFLGFYLWVMPPAAQWDPQVKGFRQSVATQAGQIPSMPAAPPRAKPGGVNSTAEQDAAFPRTLSSWRTQPSAEGPDTKMMF